MKNRKVLFSNMKGGTGKTTLCELFATYAVDQGLPIIVYDADVQLSLFKDRRDDLAANPEADTPWDVNALVVDDSIVEKMSALSTIPGIVLIDCPGNIDNDNLQPIFKAADIIVMPFRYDRKNVRETRAFSEVLENIGVTSRILYQPNMVKYVEGTRQELKDARDIAYDYFKHGKNNRNYILREIFDRTELRAANTLELNTRQRVEVRESFNKIIDFIKN